MKNELKNQSKMLPLLAFAELWERFSYYGMRTLLVLYLTSSLGFEDSKAYATYSLFAAIGYGVPVLAGIIADRFIGFQRTMIIGGIIMCFGHLSMVFAGHGELYVYLGLALIATGTGFFKGNVTSLLGIIYEGKDTSVRDKAFSLFNVAINLGSLVASLSCGYIAHKYGWDYGFALAGAGMAISVLIFLRYRHVLGEYGLRPNNTKNNTNISGVPKAIFIASLVAISSVLMLYDAEASLRYFSFVALVIFILLAKILYQCSAIERMKIFVLFIITLFFVGFIAVEMQLGSLMNLFTLRNVDKQVFGYEIPASMLQALNPLFVIIFGSSFAGTLAKFGYRVYMKRFAFGLFINILCFVAIFLGCLGAKDGQVGVIYMIISMALMSLTEVFLFPMINILYIALSPIRFKGFMMGILMFSVSYSNLASVIISKFMSIPKEHHNNAIMSLGVYQNGFYSIMIFAIGLFVLFLMLYPFLNKIVNQGEKM